MFWMRAYPVRGQVGGGWAPEIKSFLALWNGIQLIGECHLWFYVQGPTREVSGPILWEVGEQVHKGT